MAESNKKKLSGRQIKDMFYTEVDAEKPSEVGGDDPAAPSTFRCRCGKLRSQSLKHGYTNLTQHVLMKHPDWVAAVADNTTSFLPPDVAPLDATAAADASQPPQKAKRAADSSAKRNVPKKPRTARSSEDDGSSTIDAPLPLTESAGVVEQSTLAATPTKTPIATSIQTPTVFPATVTPSSATAVATMRTNVQKRADYLSWDDYFMSVAFLSAMRSKDPSTQVGACIVSPEKKIVGIGYNGFPNGCSDDELPWARASATGSPLDTKYPYVCHAEMNAILNKNSTDVKGCTIYVALFPCNECAKLIIQSGITRVVYHSDKYNTDWKFAASRRLLDMAKVSYVQHQLQTSELVINFASVE